MTAMTVTIRFGQCRGLSDGFGRQLDGDNNESNADGCIDFEMMAMALETLWIGHASVKAPDYTVTVDGDCDDGAELVNPNATEVCDGGVDNIATAS